MKSLQTGLRVLSLFATDRSSASVGTVADELGIGKSHASKILASFRMSGFLEQNPNTKDYFVGLRAVALGSQYLRDSNLVRESLGSLRRLTEQTSHTSTICVMAEDQVMYLTAVEGPRFIDVGYRVGTWLPFHATAVGKVLYASRPYESLVESCKGSLVRYTNHTITDPETLIAHLQMVRTQGFARTFGESVEGLGAVAVPVFGKQQETVAAISIIYPLDLVCDSQATDLVAMLHISARGISARLGAAFYPFGS